MGRLQDKVAIITGAGQGIGLAYAERFLDEGAKVVVAEINEERAEGAMAALEGKGDAMFVQTDISDPDSAQACVDEAVEAYGTVHILVNNAALYYDIDNFDTSFEYLQKVSAVNQHGAWLMARAASPVMAKQRYGRIINQSSGAAYMYSSRRSATSSAVSATTATRSPSGASSASRSSWPRSSASGTSRSTASRPASR